MGLYLNSRKPCALYQSEAAGPYFVDKSSLITKLIPLVEQGKQYVCITRPRRFGKTVMANMIGAFFGKGESSSQIFNRLEIARCKAYGRHINQHDVIYISFNEMPRDCNTYQQYIDRIQNRLMKDLRAAYPDSEIDEGEAVWDVLEEIYEKGDGAKYIFVLDEWDFIFHRDFVTEADKMSYISFLSNLLKDKPYVSLAYMTGILPIAKYSSGSELNMFIEFTMAKSPAFSDYFGFTEEEVDELFHRYEMNCTCPSVTRAGLQEWYNGYHTASGERVYNPRSVVNALHFNHLESYWTSSGPYDEIFYYIEKNVADVRDDLARMVAGQAVDAKVQEYAATSMSLQTKDEIFSAMVVYGFLSYNDGKVNIPNRELMDKFEDMLLKEPSLGYVYRLAKESERMLRATLAGDTSTMLEILEFVHNTEVPLLNYNNETDLTAVVNLIYLSARDTYRVEREDKAGIGYVDFIFYPRRKNETGIILELKVDSTPQEAIRQIKDKKYTLRFQGKIGEEPEYSGKVLGVGIAYDKKLKKHSCQVEVIT
ncbi:MAG: AAA family ATPase [Lachnospiraceae bacterium]|nr:AAA family ATPase [Lachnospiraceae bacterium]